MTKYCFLPCIILCFAVMIVFLTGCGSDKKEGEGKGAGRVAGSIVTPEDAPTPSLGIDLPEKVMVRLYELDKLGEKVRPIEGIGPEGLLENNRFSFSGVPEGLVNLIIRVELEDSTPVAAALVPSVREIGTAGSEIIISTESDLEVKTFMEIVKTGFHQEADTEPAHIDTVFLKSVITPEAVTAEGASATTLVPDFAEAAKAASLEYAFAMAGEQKTPSNPSLKTVRNAMREAETEYQLAFEETYYKGSRIDPDRLYELHEALADAEAEALEGVMLPAREMPEAALAARAGRARAGRFVECLRRGDEAEGCPEMKSKQETRDAIADNIEAASNAKEATHTTWDRWTRLAGMGEKPSSATSTADAGAPLTAFARLVNVHEKTDNIIHDALRQSWREIAATRLTSPERITAIGRMRLRLRNTRNYLMAIYLAEPPAAVRELEEELLRAGENLARTSSGRKSSTEAVEEEWLRLQERLDRAFQPMASRIETRFSTLEQADRKKLYWAARETTLLTSLFDLATEQYAPTDSDGDGDSDAKEKALGTDPVKDDSRPAPPLAASPASSLPPPPVDTDGDGIADAAELSAGTDPDRTDSVPTLDILLLCLSSEPANCQRPGDGTDNDNDGSSDEEKPNGTDDDGDYLIDEDTMEAPPEATIETLAIAEAEEEGTVEIESAPATVSFMEEEGTVRIHSVPATVTFATDEETPADAGLAVTSDEGVSTDTAELPATGATATGTVIEIVPKEPDIENQE